MFILLEKALLKKYSLLLKIQVGQAYDSANSWGI